ncbi:MAG: class I SAM-dependent methyltransferase [Acidobacteria bacterium]|nr:class I SAM-dependent methyltransferase [Acidobacteriota bacterium]
MPDLYTVSARYYDEAYASADDLQDVQFYVEVARRFGGPVLELACGTGRVLLPIAQNGISIDGVDSSPAMLEQLNKKLAQQEASVRQRVSVFSGDLRSFRGERRYGAVIIPFRPLQHMYTLDDQIAALKTAAFHLTDDGVLAFDVFYPRPESMLAGIGEEKLELEWNTKDDPPKTIRRSVRKDSVDKIAQHFSATYLYRTYRDGKLIREETAPLKMSWYTYPHLQALFLLAGLEPVEEYGDFDRTPMNNDSRQMIFVMRRSR